MSNVYGFKITGTLIPYDPIEYCLVNPNSAIKAARALLNRFSVANAEKEDEEREKAAKEIDEYRMCFKCSLKGIKKRYHINDMKPVPRKTKVKGKTVIFNRYLCKECAKTFKPNSQRVGGRNY